MNPPSSPPARVLVLTACTRPSAAAVPYRTEANCESRSVKQTRSTRSSLVDDTSPARIPATRAAQGVKSGGGVFAYGGAAVPRPTRKALGVTRAT